MIGILHVVEKAVRILVRLESKCERVASIGDATQVEQVNARWNMRGIYQRLRVKCSLRGFDPYFLACINFFYMAILQHHTACSFERLCQAMDVLYRIKRSLVPDHQNLFGR